MKLHIFGASGSGVTTLGTVLSDQLQLPYFDSDDYFWEPSDPPFTIRRAPPQRNTLISSTLSTADNWILGGSIIHWGDTVFPTFDLIVFLWIPHEIRLERLRRRELARYGTVIQTDPVRKMQTNDFLTWAADYDTNTGLANRTLQAHKAWIRNRAEPVLELRGELTTPERARLVLEKLS